MKYTINYNGDVCAVVDKIDKIFNNWHPVWPDDIATVEVINKTGKTDYRKLECTVRGLHNGIFKYEFRGLRRNYYNVPICSWEDFLWGDGTVDTKIMKDQFGILWDYD